MQDPPAPGADPAPRSRFPVPVPAARTLLGGGGARGAGPGARPYCMHRPPPLPPGAAPPRPRWTLVARSRPRQDSSAVTSRRAAPAARMRGPRGGGADITRLCPTGVPPGTGEAVSPPSPITAPGSGAAARLGPPAVTPLRSPGSGSSELGARGWHRAAVPVASGRVRGGGSQGRFLGGGPGKPLGSRRGARGWCRFPVLLPDGALARCPVPVPVPAPVLVPVLGAGARWSPGSSRAGSGSRCPWEPRDTRCGSGAQCPVPFSVPRASVGTAARCPVEPWERGAAPVPGAELSAAAVLNGSPGFLTAIGLFTDRTTGAHRHPTAAGTGQRRALRSRFGGPRGSWGPVPPGVIERRGHTGAAGTEAPVSSRDGCLIPAPRSPAAFRDKPGRFRVGPWLQTGAGSSAAPTCWARSQSRRCRGVGPEPGSGSAPAPRAPAAAPEPPAGPRRSPLSPKQRILFRRLWPEYPPGTRFSGEKAPGGPGDNRWGRTEVPWGRGCRCAALLPPSATSGTGAAARSSGGEGRMPPRRGGGGRGGRGLRGGRRHLLPGPAMPGGAGPGGRALVYVQLSGFLFPRCPPGPAEDAGTPPGCSGKARPRNAAPHSLHGPGVKLRRTAPVQSTGGRFWCTVPVNGFVAKLQCPASVQGSGARCWCPAPKHSRGIRLRGPARFTAPVPGPVPSPSARRLSGREAGGREPPPRRALRVFRATVESNPPRGAEGSGELPGPRAAARGSAELAQHRGDLAVAARPDAAPAISKQDEMGGGCPPRLTTPGARGAPGAPGPAPLPARRSAAGARGESQLRVAAATGEYHKKPEAPGARRSPRCGGGPAPGAGGCPGVGRGVGDTEGCGGPGRGGLSLFLCDGEPRTLSPVGERGVPAVSGAAAGAGRAGNGPRRPGGCRAAPSPARSARLHRRGVKTRTSVPGIAAKLRTCQRLLAPAAGGGGFSGMRHRRQLRPEPRPGPEGCGARRTLARLGRVCVCPHRVPVGRSPEGVVFPLWETARG
ncbi:collagen alpha-1(I) chain-like [Vidua macroura]|uniref:collagen alpha-1(I) chain-like n=1 Tax=Vidua macroura TaxID=187451 RepID=UPI0023A7C8E0|nr:collagen alpha-1(I) chain-like [Vidua macroura]